jgi:transposase
MQTIDDTTELDEILKTLSVDQLRYIVARQEYSSKRDAAKAINMSYSTVTKWDERVDRAAELMALDGVHVARAILRKTLPKAMAVKAGGLDSDNERIRQDAATEIIDREFGKSVQKNELTGKDGGAIQIERFAEAIRQVYGGD